MPFGWVAAAVAAVTAVVQHVDAKKAQGQNAQAIANQQRQGEQGLAQQQDATNKQLEAQKAAFEEQKAADAAKIDSANKAMELQKSQFDTAQQTQQKQFADSLYNSNKQFADQLAQKDAADKEALKQAGDSANAQQSAMQGQLAAAQASFNMQSEQINKANQKAPDAASIISANKQQAKSGQSGTMLTGSSGVDSSQLLLGKNTLLGS